MATYASQAAAGLMLPQSVAGTLVRMTIYSTRGVAAVLALLLGLVLTLTGGWLRLEHGRLESRGVEVPATVLQLMAHGKPGQQQFEAMLRPRDQEAVEIRVRLTPAQHASLEEGSEVAFAYLPDDPSTYMLGGLGKVRELEIRDVVSMCGGVGLILLGAGLFRRNSGRRRKGGLRPGLRKA
jgi:hypothetical protein